MICTIYTNCQGGVLEHYLHRHRKFTKNYQSRFYILGHETFSRPMESSLRTRLMSTDLFIYMFIEPNSALLSLQMENGNLSSEQALWYQTDYILHNLLPKRCRTISMPNAHFEGYHIEHCRDPRNSRTLTQEHPWGLFAYGNRTLMNLIEEYKPLSSGKVERIIETMNRPDLYSPSEIASHFDKSLELLQAKEKFCDVKVSEFIKTNFAKKYLFNAVNHPTHHILNYIANQVLQRLDYEPLEFIEYDPFSHYQVPVTPCIINHYKFPFLGADSTYAIDTLGDKRLTYNQYLLKYITILYGPYQ